jgi:hypothetical protein
MKIFDEKIDPKSAARTREIALLFPTFLVVILLIMHFVSSTGSIPAWGGHLFFLSPLMVIYNLILLSWFARRSMPRWIKVTDMSLIILALVPQVISAFMVVHVLTVMHQHPGTPPGH